MKLLDILYDYQFKTTFDTELCGLDFDLVSWTLGSLHCNIGEAFVDQHAILTGTNILEAGKEYLLQFNHFQNAKVKCAELLSVLGYCYLCSGNADAAEDCLLDAVELWTKLNFPLFKIEICVNTMKYYVESKIRGESYNADELHVCTDMLMLHKSLGNRGLQLTEVPEAFHYLARMAFLKEKEKTSLAFFEKALTLYRQLPPTESNRDIILQLLCDVGITCYNCRCFSKAVEAYTECLSMLKQGCNGVSLSSSSSQTKFAECCAALGFTYSRLRNFDMMLEYYEKALELQTRLAADDLELIETNIGSLYHVKAVLHSNKNEELEAAIYFRKSEAAFTTALKYSWRSFPYINYGYYLLCRQKYQEAEQVLQQGYLNGVVDRDTVEFDHTEDPILLEDLKKELEDCDDIRMPSTIIALYLKTLSQQRGGDTDGAKHTANQFKHELQVCKFESYYTEGFGLDRMKALCHSLLGYAYKEIGLRSDSRCQFLVALECMPEYRPAIKNIKLFTPFN